MGRIITPATVAAPEGSVIAVLGPTNTGKTHYAHGADAGAQGSGVIGSAAAPSGAGDLSTASVALRGPSQMPLP